MAAANNEFFEALSMLEHERGITAEYLIEKIKAAIVIAVKKNYEVEDDNVMVEIDPATGKFNVALLQNVVADEDWYDEHAEIGLTEAQKLRKSYEIGDRVVTPLKTKDFGRIAAQTAKHVIRQGIREAERSQQLSEIQSRAHDIIQATVTRVDNEKGIVALDLGKGGEAILPRNEQVPGETYTEGETLQVYVVDVVSGERGARVMISRTHPGLVKRLFELEVPEIYDGMVEIKSIAREPGARSKIAVASREANLDPVGACVGVRGSRIQNIVQELHGERIDIVVWSPEISTYARNALAPAVISRIVVDEAENLLEVTVPDDQLTSAIGRKGQNVKLAAKLLGWKIDIFTETRYNETNAIGRGLEQVASVAEVSVDSLVSAGFTTLEQLQDATDEELSEKLSLSDSRIGDLRAAINFLSPVVGESADKADADADKADETAAGEDE